MSKKNGIGYWDVAWRIFRDHKLGVCALFVLGLFYIFGIYAPFFASSKPFVLRYEGTFYFPFFRYLFFQGFYTKGIDLFFNLLMFTLPAFLAALICFRKGVKFIFSFFILLQLALFGFLLVKKPDDPASSPDLNREKFEKIKRKSLFPSWEFDLKYMTSYAKLNLITENLQRKKQQAHLGRYQSVYKKKFGGMMPTLRQLEKDQYKDKLQRLNKEKLRLEKEGKENTDRYKEVYAQILYTLDKREWIEKQSQKVTFIIWPFFSIFHWQDDAGGSQSLNSVVDWWNLTRINQKSLIASLIFGIRISLVVGVLAVALSLLIGVPVGSVSGFYGGRVDIAIMRFLEIWESMPVFFMLLFVVAITQNKSIFLVITVIGFFNWTGISRYLRGEFLKQRNLSYVEACHSIGYDESRIIFGHILPNAVPPVLTLLPFAIMGAITSEAALSFLGLGEEGSSSWGVLMDEGRQAFPGESYLLWPPAILLTILLIAIALVGDALRDALDPKMHK